MCVSLAFTVGGFPFPTAVTPRRAALRATTPALTMRNSRFLLMSTLSCKMSSFPSVCLSCVFFAICLSFRINRATSTATFLLFVCSRCHVVVLCCVLLYAMRKSCQFMLDVKYIYLLFNSVIHVGSGTV